MRIHPLPHELTALARRLTAVPPPARRFAALRLILEAEAAGRRFARTGRPHPRHGDGSLIARLCVDPLPPERFADCPDFLTALHIAAEALLKHTARSQISMERGGRDGRLLPDRTAGEDHGRDSTAGDNG
ncbi:DUF7742 family protein [Xinfangfangia pollutisoli]|uniref:DUF7742 family protein n=1 Tax=Xinfangfangia pollutisoli TaxID=2865960 RepID=UPI001CD4BC0F|nr:hypothetical protein [Xinfangfangia pollutisoli]